MKVIVVANCQARPVSAMLNSVDPSLEMIDPIILHLARPADTDRDLETLTKADVIFAQLTSSNFKPHHLATSTLKAAFPGRVIVWPNVFYAGYQPYLRYFTKPGLGRLLGPFEAMHDLRLYRSWLRTGRVDPAAALQADPDIVAMTARVSLEELRTRETQTDVAVSDLIGEDPHSEPLFFTFNHPKFDLLTSLVRRLLVAAHLKGDRSPLPRREPLGRYRVPGIDSASDLQGDDLMVRSRQPIAYNLNSLVAAFQSVNDGNPLFRDPNGIRLTPTIGWEQQFLSLA